MASETTARLIAEMYEARRWSPPLDVSDNPILGPVVQQRRERYGELKSRMSFGEAALQADIEAIEAIMRASIP